MFWIQYRSVYCITLMDHVANILETPVPICVDNAKIVQTINTKLYDRKCVEWWGYYNKITIISRKEEFKI